MKYFHIDTKSQHRAEWIPFSVGEKYKVGDKINPSYANWMNSATRERVGVTKKDVDQSIAVMMRELAFENLRLRQYSTLPSRTSCIWLCDSMESAKYWVNRIPHCGEKNILEVEILSGNVHKATEVHLTNNLENINELEIRAHKYWSGEGCGECEFLFQGELNIIRKVSA